MVYLLGHGFKSFEEVKMGSSSPILEIKTKNIFFETTT